MTEYSGKVYRLTTPDGSMNYYGSTKTDLRKRLSGHKADWIRWKNGKFHFISSFKLFETGLPVDIVLVEELKGTKEQIHARERYHIESNDCVNKSIPGRTTAESSKAYYNNNKETILEKHRAWYDTNKEKKLELTKAYHDANRVRRLEQMKDYYQRRKLLAQNPDEPEKMI